MQDNGTRMSRSSFCSTTFPTITPEPVTETSTSEQLMKLKDDMAEAMQVMKAIASTDLLMALLSFPSRQRVHKLTASVHPTPEDDMLALRENSVPSQRTILHCGERRFTFCTDLPNKGALQWQNMKQRLAEVKLQTLLQTFSSESEHPAYKVVLTGGPCAGKSSGMVKLRGLLEQNDFNVFCVPEAATILIDGGGVACFTADNDDALFRFQLALLETQLALEDAFQALAKVCNKKAVLLCDRGSMDGRAFCTEAIWNRILKEGEWSTSELRDSRYDLVLHLVTAAQGAEEFYACDNNTARTESPEQAREQDAKLLAMWTGFPMLRVIDNSTSFNDKLKRCVQPILDLVGIGNKSGAHRRYSIADPPSAASIPLPTTQSESTIHVLSGSKPNNTISIVHRRDGKASTYTYRTVRKKKDEIFKVERPLSHKAYQSLLDQVDHKVPCVKKNNITFIYECQYFELGVVTEPAYRSGQAFLSVETTRDHRGREKSVIMPPFLEVCGLEDVTLKSVCLVNN
eukprot:TRINITY_DN9944_c0_g1_i1.p1 TRINITY_DN9944_c0_g1~~TRINITY_DN9944_c0_g1_i1.p1  ORF type:complete len:526 (+),score=99.73 TRINITY_DN9944_c0_g1_i1:34-1578(+)